MKRCIFIVLMVCGIAPVYATYYEITTNIYTPGLTLQTGDSLYMTDGGFDSLTLTESSAIVEGTSTLQQFFGGIWTLSLLNTSELSMSGGQIHELSIVNDATAFLSGGLIQQIWSQQYTEYWDNDNQVWVDTAHITIECLDHYYDPDTNLLTGHWLDDETAFSILLIDIDGYGPAIDNIQFVPEPATLALLSAGALILRKRKR